VISTIHGQELNETRRKIKTMPWQGKGIKYAFPNSGLVVEEIRDPWDLLVESKYLNNNLADPVHVLAIQNGIERIFSIRDKDRRVPLADILTMPVNGRNLDPFWATQRVLKTSNPMKVDGQELIVLDVLQNDTRASKYWRAYAAEFFEAKGGILGNEHPHCLALNSKKEIKKWGRLSKGKDLPNMLIANKPAYRNIVHCHATTKEEALALLERSFIGWLYVCVDDAWTKEVIDHLEKEIMDRPEHYMFYGELVKVDASVARVKSM
jgi:hypothetical protein